MQQAGKGHEVDPVTFEILSHRLQRIAKEMGTTIERVGGTVNTTQMHDYMASLYRPDGEILATGESMPWHVACAGFTVRAIIDRFAEYDGVNEDDVFLLNDPYVSAVHQSDVYIVSPIHVEGRLIGWSASFVHVMDIGAMSPGGDSPEAKEICHEGVRVPGIKLVDRGSLRKDVFDTLINMTRRPDMVALDINCQLAGHSVAKARMQELYSHYGVELMDAVAAQMIDYSERALRKRLEEIPDGEWSDSAAIESKAGSWTVRLTLKKRGSHMLFDFTGTDPQSSVGVNLPFHATFGTCFEGIVETVAYDLPRNHGLFRPIETVAPEGTLVNVKYPAPVSLNTTSGGATAKYLAVSVLNGMLAGSEKWRNEIMVRIWGGRRVRTSGINQHGTFYSTSLAMSPLSGSGARANMDGVDTTKLDFMTCPNVEWLEMNCPMLFLFRRHAKDQQGAGRFRGGTGAEMAFAMHKAPEKKIGGVAFGVAGFTNGGRGIFGGYPGAPSILVHLRGTSLGKMLESNRVPENTGQLGGTAQVLPYASFELRENDVLYYTLGMGGGFGSPLDRDPQAVLKDVENELVSPEMAREVYGVIVDPERRTLDLPGTEKLRRQRRKENLEARP
jgi:N-methylhydantoinase B